MDGMGLGGILVATCSHGFKKKEMSEWDCKNDTGGVVII